MGSIMTSQDAIYSMGKPSNKELLLSAYILGGSSLALAGELEAAAAEFRAVKLLTSVVGNPGEITCSNGTSGEASQSSS